MNSSLLAIALFLVVCISPGVTKAQGDYGSTVSKPKGLNNATTNRLVRKLERGIRLCQSIETVYRYDCYRQNYKTAADQLEGNSAYALPRQTLRDIEQTLQTIVAGNADPNAKPVRKGGQTFRPVTPASTAKAKETFRRSLDTAATVLLRSSGDNAKHFSRIAQALDSDKILLRSTLLRLRPAYQRFWFRDIYSNGPSINTVGLANSARASASMM